MLVERRLRGNLLPKVAVWLLLGLVGVVGLGMGVYCSMGFFPESAVEFVGPAGGKYRAFVENRSFQDVGYTLCVSDWPYTLLEPISLESVLYSEGSSCRVFWSVDGTVVVARDAATGESKAAYDYPRHELIRYDASRIDALVRARGGLGPEFADYRDGKENIEKAGN